MAKLAIFVDGERIFCLHRFSVFSELLKTRHQDDAILVARASRIVRRLHLSSDSSGEFSRFCKAGMKLALGPSLRYYELTLTAYPTHFGL